MQPVKNLKPLKLWRNGSLKKLTSEKEHLCKYVSGLKVENNHMGAVCSAYNRSLKRWMLCNSF